MNRLIKLILSTVVAVAALAPFGSGVASVQTINLDGSGSFLFADTVYVEDNFLVTSSSLIGTVTGGIHHINSTDSLRIAQNHTFEFKEGTLQPFDLISLDLGPHPAENNSPTLMLRGFNSASMEVASTSVNLTANSFTNIVFNSTWQNLQLFTIDAPSGDYQINTVVLNDMPNSSIPSPSSQPIFSTLFLLTFLGFLTCKFFRLRPSQQS